jgi:hypothetical protein
MPLFTVFGACCLAQLAVIRVARSSACLFDALQSNDVVEGLSGSSRLLHAALQQSKVRATFQEGRLTLP